MKITEVEKITGLSQKAIRLYESKGLIRVARDDNGYRNYSDGDIRELEHIKLLRRNGAPNTDIKLYKAGIITVDELMEKRKHEIVKENGKNSEQYRICETLTKKTMNDEPSSRELFTETEIPVTDSHGALSVGIDIGTTTICAVIIDIENHEQLEVYSLPHNSYVCTEAYSCQSVSIIMDKAEKLLSHLMNSYSNIVSIGLSGQMHGIVYLNREGKAVSDLINWQDKRADQPLANENGKTTCEVIKAATGENIATGYGIATHYYNFRNGLIPADAVSFCSIMDLLGMRLCGLKKPIIHASVAASFGLFDIKNCAFMADKLALLGIDRRILPTVTSESMMIGKHHGIPVAIALGDNQASILGSLKDNDTGILVNIGTGSQVSAVCDSCNASGELEIRPFVEGKYLVCGSALCGGYAYSMLEAFFRSYAVSAGMQDTSQYDTLNSLSVQAYEKGEVGLEVDVSFLGRRNDPTKKGSIRRIDPKSFTPSRLVLGVLCGMCDELHEMYGSFQVKRSHIVASGGAVRKNKILRKLIADRFGMTVSLNAIPEEAATGAALFAAFAVGRIGYNNGFSDFIRYEASE